MIILLGILLVVALGYLGFFFFRIKRLEKLVLVREREAAAARDDAQRAYVEAQSGLAEAQRQLDHQLEEQRQEAERIRLHYEGEAQRIFNTTNEMVLATTQQYESLHVYAGLQDTEAEAQRLLAEAVNEASGLRADAQTLLEQARAAADAERAQATQRARELRQQADSLLSQATRDAGSIVETAHRSAEQIGGDAYTALRDKAMLENAVRAIRNVVDGYGDRYIVPTRSLLDDLAADYGHMEAGEALRAAREHSRRLVEQGQAGTCEYAETNRRVTAIRSVLDAFNGRADSILSRTKHDNYGTLEQEIRDAFSLVNLNGKAFRDARVLPAYLDARLAELKWAVTAQELKLREREEQQRIREQMREEEKARREYERAIQEAQKEEQIIRRALAKARLEADQASSEQKAKFEEQVAMLNQQLTEAEARNQRALSMAQQTKKGNVYVISNVGAFGEDVFKIGLTRRLEPMDRVKELGDAAVPFAFDVHAMIASDDAPALEHLLHKQFDDTRINKVNYRKEFFRLPLAQRRTFLAERGIEPSFTMLAAAREYRETQALNLMSPEEREQYRLRRLRGELFEVENAVISEE